MGKKLSFVRHICGSAASISDMTYRPLLAVSMVVATGLATGLATGFATGCAMADLDAGPDPGAAGYAEVLQHLVKCPADVCGLNSAAFSDGGFFYDLNLDEAPNRDGVSLVGAKKGSAIYDLDVVNGRFIATFVLGPLGSPRTLRGDDLAGLELRLRRIRADGTFAYSTLAIESVARVTDYWARPTSGVTPKIETYKFHYRIDSGYGAYLCQNGAEFVDGSSPVRAMPEHHALIFEGERIDIDSLTIAPALSPRWFTIGCAETALAKMQLTGHTQAAQSVGLTTTVLERQTMLKMLTADYCGTGNSFTVSGQPLRWTDHRGTMRLSASFPKVLEARWTPYGAACLNTPRVDAHPSEASAEKFELGARLEIDHACSIPVCLPTQATYHLLSWNPTPFTL